MNINININPQVLVPLVSSIPDASTDWKLSDYLGAFRVRWGIRRNTYRTESGIYKVGKPDRNSDVFVTANYKLSFDILRKNLDGLNAWILVLDTKGINVWCAAGKGTFGTNELINRIKLTSLSEIVTHRRVIIPQLGAVGIAAHIVQKKTGFKIIYGPVRASDIKVFIKNRYKANPKMRTVQFTFYDRLKLVPVELIVNKFYLLSASVVIIFLYGINNMGYQFKQVGYHLLDSIAYVIATYFSGLLVAPLLLPYLPARSFALKGFYAGTILFAILFFTVGFTKLLIENIALFFIMTAGSSFLMLNFTGASTYTSLSGVKKEMKLAIPLQIISIVMGIVLLIISRIYGI